MKTLRLLLIPLILLTTSMVQAADKPPLLISELPDFTIPRGRVIYQRYCLFCHGETGKGDGQNAYSLPVKPADLSAGIAGKTADQLSAAITGGETAANDLSPAMPDFARTLSDQQVKQLIIYLQSMAKQN